ncbi:Vomp family autotransporter [Bartonella vinsonii]|nr:Vomp family autotransporter [Bartonella vinsonii]
MKKLYAIQTAMRNLKNSRFSFVKVMLSLAIMIAFLSNVFSVNAGDVQPKNVKANEKAKSSEVSSSVPVNEQAATSGSADAGVMNVDVTANAEGLQANNVSEDSRFSGRVTPVTDLSRSFSTNGMQRAGSANSIWGDGISVGTSSGSVFIGDNVTVAGGKGVVGVVVIGNGAKVGDGWNVVIGVKAEAAIGSYNAVALGRGAKTEGAYSIAIGGIGTTGNNGQDVDEKNRVLAVGDYAIAFGYSSKSYEEKGIAIGANAIVSASSAIAIGPSAKAEKNNGIVIGKNSSVSGVDSIAIGNSAETLHQDSISIGYMAHAMGRSSVAIGGEYNDVSTHGEGDYTTAKSDYTTAVGAVSKALGYGATALGHRAYAFAEKAISIGFYSKANEVGSIALGVDSKATVKDGIALGRDSVANRAAGAFGYASSLKGSTTNTNAQWKSTYGVVSVGDFDNNITRQITGVAAGSEPSDAVNVGQLKDLEDVVRKNGWKLSVDNANGTTVLMNSGVDFSVGSKNLTITKGDKDNKLKFDLAKNVTLNSAKMGGGTTLDATGLVIVNGPKITTTGISAGNKEIKDVKAGDLSATSNQAVNGSQLFETNKNVTTFSNDLKTVAQHAAQYFGGGAEYTNGKWTAPTFMVKSFTSDGSVSDSTYNNVAAAFAGVSSSFENIKDEITNQINIAQHDALLWSDEKKAFVARRRDIPGVKTEEEGLTQRLTSLTNGDISAGSTDAITGGQLFETNNKVATYLGGGASYEKGLWTAPTFMVKSFTSDGSVSDSTYNNVAAAFAGVSSSFENIKNEITNQINIAQHDALLWSDEKKAFVAERKNIPGMKPEGEGITQRLTSLTNGGIFSGSTDAITGDQLYSLGDKVAQSLGGNASYEKGSWTAPTFKVKSFTSDGGVSDSTYNDVAAAFEGVGTSFEKVKDSITNVKNEITQEIKNEITNVKGDSLVKQEPGTNHITIGADTDGDKIDIADKNSNKRTLTGIKHGALLEDSNEAVTGSQLFETNNKVATYLGGGASYAEGKWTAPTFKIKTVKEDGKTEDKDYKSVASAFEGIGTSITNVKNEISTQINNEITNVQGDALSWDKTKGAFVATHGEEGSKTNSKLTSLQSGDISANSTDAVTGSQLFTTNQNVTTVGTNIAKAFGGGAKYENGAWTAPTFKVKSFASDGGVSDSTYNDVAAAFEGVGTSFEKVKDSITNVKNEITKEIKNEITNVKGDSLVKWDEGHQIIKIGAEKYGNTITIADKDGKGRTLSGLKAAEHNDEAVNKGQLDESLKKLSNSLQSDESAVVHYDKAGDENGTINYASVTFGGKEKPSVGLHNVADGKVAEGSHDAITGGQLYSLSSEVAKYFGGGASYAEGKWTAPSFKVKTVNEDGTKVEEKVYTDVASALSGVGSSITNVQNKVTEQVNNVIKKVESESFVQQDKTTYRLTIGAAVEGTEINIANKDKEDRILSGLKAATKDNEAVNKGQLDKSLQDLSNNLQSDESAVVHYDKTDDKNGSINYTSVTFGKGKSSTPVGLHNVADGKIVKGSHDAITGSQVNKIGEDIAQFLGGNATFNNGALTQPTYKLSYVDKDGVVTETSFQGVGTAFSGLDINIQNVNQRIKEVSQGVAQDSLSWDKETLAFVAKHGEEKTNSKITSLQNGTISENSTDAVNGSQLYSMGDTVAKYFGGNTTFKDGVFTAPTYKISNVSEDGKVTAHSYSDVGSAFEELDTNVKNVNNHLTNEVKKFEEKITNITQEVQGDALLWDKTKGAFVATHGKDKTNSKITSLQNGTISENSTDAVNGSQLYSMGDTIAKYFGGGASYAEGQWIAPTFTIKTVKEDGKTEDKNYNDVASAFAGVGSSITNVKNEITKQINNEIANVKGDSLVKKDSETNLITIGKEVEGTEINIVNKDQGDRTLSGLKAATKDNEAVNKGQLDESLKKLSTSLQSDESAVVHYDKTDDKNGSINYTSVTFGKGKSSTPVGLHNVADGKISDKSYDVINGSQINKISQDVAKFLGGDAKFSDGAFTEPTYKLSKVSTEGKVEEAEFKNVGSAFSGLDENIKNVNQRIKDVSESVAQDSLNWSKDAGAFVATHGEKDSKTNSKLTSLLDGAINDSSTDAVTGKQLYTLGSNVAKSLGGGASYAEGKWTAPSFTVKTVKDDGVTLEEKKYNTVAEALADVGASFTNIKNDITNVVSDSLVKQEKKGDPITIGKETDGTIINLQNKNNEGRSISGVIGGTISKDSNEAVNGSQLFTTNQNMTTVATNIAKTFGGGASYAEGKWIAPKFTVKTVKEDGSDVEEHSYESVAEAFAGVGTSFTNIQTEFKNEINKVVGDSLVKQDEKTQVIKIGGEKAGSEITIVNSDGVARSLSGVKAASLSETSTEAVNGSQLYSLNTTLAKYFGGSAEYKDGQWTAPSFKLTTYDDDGTSHEESYESVAAAFAGVSSSFTKLHNEISNNLEQNALLWSNEEKAFVALHGEGSKKEKSKLKSLLDGDIAEGSSEAVTGNQLYSLNQTLAQYFGGGAGYKEGQWTSPEFKVAQFKSDGSSDEKKIYHDVASAFDGVSDGMTKINDRIQDVEKNVASNGLNWNEDKGAYDAKHNGNSSKIINVAGGKIEKGSQEVVNGGQLWETNKKVKAVEDKVDTIDQQVKDIAHTVTDGVVSYDKDASGKKTNKVTLVGGTESDPVLIDNVADGTIEKGSHQAVNGGQLHDYTEKQMKLVLDDAKKYTDEQVGSVVNNAINEAKSYTDMKFETLSYAVEDVRKEARQAAAIGLAVSSLRYYDIAGSLSVSFGSGTWRSQSAIAFGAGYTSEDGNIRSNISVTSAGGHWGVGAGVTLRLR